MKVRILDSAYIVDFIGEGFSSIQILFAVKSETERIMQSAKIEKLQDLEVCFRFCYNNVRQILIYTKGKSYSIEKYKEITVHIPIPIKIKAAWGVELEQHAYKDENHLDNLMKNFHLLEVDYSKFTNRQDYILDCMRRAIKFCFENGFTINGEKVKISPQAPTGARLR